eukprot:c14363_g1_i2 orf=822-1046(+)
MGTVCSCIIVKSCVWNETTPQLDKQCRCDHRKEAKTKQPTCQQKDEGHPNLCAVASLPCTGSHHSQPKHRERER